MELSQSQDRLADHYVDRARGPPIRNADNILSAIAARQVARDPSGRPGFSLTPQCPEGCPCRTGRLTGAL